jgi:hypothetical protein
MFFKLCCLAPRMKMWEGSDIDRLVKFFVFIECSLICRGLAVLLSGNVGDAENSLAQLSRFLLPVLN